MTPGDTVITLEGKEGKVSHVDEPNQWRDFRLVWVDFTKPNYYWKVFIESELKVKEEKK